MKPNLHIFSVRFTTVVLAVGLLSPEVALAGRTDLECAILSDCRDNDCSAIEPAPILLRYVGIEESVTVFAYGSERVMGGLLADEDTSIFYGHKISDGRTFMAFDDEHGSRDGHLFIQLDAPNSGKRAGENGRITLLIAKSIDRHWEGKCISSAVVVAGAGGDEWPSEQVLMRGECFWKEDHCRPSDILERGTSSD